MDNFKILIRLLTNKGNRSDIAFNFEALPDLPPLAAAARACIERADMPPASGGVSQLDISQLDISVCDSQHNWLETIRIHTHGSQAVFEPDGAMLADSPRGFALDPGDADVFHLAAHVLLAERSSQTLKAERLQRRQWQE